MKIIVLGAGTIIPTRERFGSSILLETSLGGILLDIGPGTIEKLKRIRYDLETINRILITHFHIDHVSDLLPFLKMRGLSRKSYGRFKEPLDIYGPRGLNDFIEDLLVKNRFLSYLMNLDVLRDVRLHECWDGVVAADERLEIRSVPVEHFNGVAYRIRVDGIDLVYSGDTVPDERLIRLAENVDVLIHECSYPSGQKLGKHTSDEELIEIVSRIRPRITIAIHLYPEMEGRVQSLRESLRKASGGLAYVPSDLDVIEV